jgi:hypothetical protein
VIKIKRFYRFIIFILIASLLSTTLISATPPDEYGVVPTFSLPYLYIYNSYKSVDGIMESTGVRLLVSDKLLHLKRFVNESGNYYIFDSDDINLEVYQYRSYIDNGVPKWVAAGSGLGVNNIVLWDHDIRYTNVDLYQLDYMVPEHTSTLFHRSDEFVTPPIENCNMYKVGVGDTLNIQNSSTGDQFFYFKATNATYEKIVSIGSEYPTINNYEDLTSSEWEWMEPEAGSNYNYWKITQGTIEIGVPNDSPLVVKVTRKVPNGGYDTMPSPDRGNYEDGIFGTISYGIDTLIYWVSYPFVAVGQLFVGLIDEIKNNLGWINDFTGLTGILFGWIPERFQGLLFICASATVISFIIRVFRGS